MSLRYWSTETTMKLKISPWSLSSVKSLARSNGSASLRAVTALIWKRLKLLSKPWATSWPPSHHKMRSSDHCPHFFFFLLFGIFLFLGIFQIAVSVIYPLIHFFRHILQYFLAPNWRRCSLWIAAKWPALTSLVLSSVSYKRISRVAINASLSPRIGDRHFARLPFVRSTDHQHRANRIWHGPERSINPVHELQRWYSSPALPLRSNPGTS